ncbi:hypothetical protein KFU94_53430 [Chloroflexi bacterium TSY]|nr:hypothetical protein [Chloroflexi bacterium TSY]
MNQPTTRACIHFSPNPEDMKSIAEDVSELPAIQRMLLDKHKELHLPDRVAHQYQIMGGKVVFKAANKLPPELEGIGLFEPSAEHVGIGRISTGQGTPHLETNPDFLGIMCAFQTRDDQRVDFLGINDPRSPADNHQDFMDVLQAAGESADAGPPIVADWGAYDIFKFLDEQFQFSAALRKRMGWIKAGKTIIHLAKQTFRTFHSSTAYQVYWTGIVKVRDTAGKFTFVPIRDENRRPGFRPGERHLTEEWKRRQREGDIKFQLFWIPFLSEDKTPSCELTEPWHEEYKKLVGTVTFPKIDLDSEEASLWAILALEMGANPGNWVHDEGNTIKEPATEFGLARKLAYQKSQEGRNVLEPTWYKSVFKTGQISPELAQELARRRQQKEELGHISYAVFADGTL